MGFYHFCSIVIIDVLGIAKHLQVGINHFLKYIEISTRYSSRNYLVNIHRKAQLSNILP